MLAAGTVAYEVAWSMIDGPDRFWNFWTGPMAPKAGGQWFLVPAGMVSIRKAITPAG